MRIALRSSFNHNGRGIKKNLDTLLFNLSIPLSNLGVLSRIGVLRIVVAGFIHLNRESDIGSCGCEGAVDWFLVRVQNPWRGTVLLPR